METGPFKIKPEHSTDNTSPKPSADRQTDEGILDERKKEKDTSNKEGSEDNNDDDSEDDD